MAIQTGLFNRQLRDTDQHDAEARRWISHAIASTLSRNTEQNDA
ncbi:MAG: hypothetical protein ACR5LD_09780 [Symbiopectobacterium sp.]